MKYFIIPALLLCVTLGLGQSHTVKPPISTTSLDSNTVTSGSATVYSRKVTRYNVDSCIVTAGNDTVRNRGTGSDPFSLILAGATVTSDSSSFGAGITVLSVLDSGTIVLSDTVTGTTDSMDVLRFRNPGAYSSASVGMRIQGAGIPLGTTISALGSNDTTMTISASATATDTLQAVRFNYFTSLAYSAGDALGFPVAVPPFGKLKQVVLIDDAKQITSADLVFFNAAFTETADNAAFGPSDADAENIIGYLTVGGTGANKALGNNTVMVLPFTTIGPAFSQGGTMYCQLVVVGTPTFTAVDNLTLKFIFE